MQKLLFTGLICLLFECGFSQGWMVLPNLNDPKLKIIDAPSFSIQIKENKNVLLLWESTDSSLQYFTVERSSNNLNFETIGVIKNEIGLGKFSWMDEQPITGKSYYRIKCNNAAGFTARTISQPAFINGALDFKFYPNPVDNILIVRTEQPLEISILDLTGKLKLNFPQVSGLQPLNVSSLEKGIYWMRVYNKTANTINLERLAKN